MLNIEEIEKIQKQYFQRVHQNNESTDNSLLILGMGRNHMGDKCVGAHVIKELDNLIMPKNVFILDGGAGNYDLMEILSAHDIVIVVDGIDNGKPIGSYDITFHEDSSDFPKTISSEDVGIKDIASGLDYMGEMPEIALITISIDPKNDNKDLSIPIKAVIPDLVVKINEMTGQILAEL